MTDCFALEWIYRYHFWEIRECRVRNTSSYPEHYLVSTYQDPRSITIALLSLGVVVPMYM